MHFRMGDLSSAMCFNQIVYIFCEMEGITLTYFVAQCFSPNLHKLLNASCASTLQTNFFATFCAAVFWSMLWGQILGNRLEVIFNQG